MFTNASQILELGIRDAFKFYYSLQRRHAKLRQKYKVSVAVLPYMCCQTVKYNESHEVRVECSVVYLVNKAFYCTNLNQITHAGIYPT